jgi:hypothetical protein
MSLDVPYERLSPTLKVDYIPLKLALNDLPNSDVAAKNENDSGNDDQDNPKIDINVPNKNVLLMNETAPKQMYDAMVLGMLTVFCILVLLYAIYYFVILRDRQKSIEPAILMY